MINRFMDTFMGFSSLSAQRERVQGSRPLIKLVLNFYQRE